MTHRDLTYSMSVGNEVQDKDGVKVGKTGGTSGDRLIVKIGWWKLAKSYYIPKDEVSSYEQGVVRLRRSLDYITSRSDWSKKPKPPS